MHTQRDEMKYVETNLSPEQRQKVADEIILAVFKLNIISESLLRKNIFKYYKRFLASQKEALSEAEQKEQQEHVKKNIKEENRKIIKNLFKN